jgi:hypothetical protein
MSNVKAASNTSSPTQFLETKKEKYANRRLGTVPAPTAVPSTFHWNTRQLGPCGYRRFTAAITMELPR